MLGTFDDQIILFEEVSDNQTLPVDADAMGRFTINNEVSEWSNGRSD